MRGEVMPMDFPDMESLRLAARVHGFRITNNSESEADYREALADHVAQSDLIESQEIRNGVGWGKWTGEQEKDLLQKSGMV